MHTPLARALPLLLSMALLSSATTAGQELARPPASQGAPPPPAAPPHGPPPRGPSAPGDGPPAFMSPKEADGSIPRGLLVNEPGAFDGYTLVMPLNAQAVYLIDLAGEVVHTWETDSAPGGWCYLLEDGSLLRLGREDREPSFRGGGIGGRIQKLAPDGTVLWHYELASPDAWQHHDAEPLPNGDVIVIAWERKSAREAVARGRDPRQVGEAGLWPDALFQIHPTPPEGGEIVWEWHSWDHLVQDRDPKLPGYGAIADHPGRIDIDFDHRDEPPPTPAELERQAQVEAQMAALGYASADEEEDEAAPDEEESKWDKSGDWLHTNAVDYHPGLDLLVISSPEACELFVLDHSTTTAEAATDHGGRYGKGGEILWRWGNPKNYGAGTKDDQRLFYQHDPTWVAGEGLRVQVFDNGSGRPDGDYSSVEELVLPFDPARGFLRESGRPFGPTEPAWSYTDVGGFYSAFISGAQRLPNGNTLVCSGAAGRLFEVTRDGSIVWDYRNPLGGDVDPPDHAGKAPPLALFRGARYAKDHPGMRRVLQ